MKNIQCSVCGIGPDKWHMCESSNPNCSNKFKMEAYIGSKIIKGAPMTHHEFLNKVKNEDIPTGTPDQDGYLVEYPDGYKSWSPKANFEEAYRKVSQGEKDLLYPSDLDVESESDDQPEEKDDAESQGDD